MLRDTLSELQGSNVEIVKKVNNIRLVSPEE